MTGVRDNQSRDAEKVGAPQTGGKKESENEYERRRLSIYRSRPVSFQFKRERERERRCRFFLSISFASDLFSISNDTHTHMHTYIHTTPRYDQYKGPTFEMPNESLWLGVVSNWCFCVTTTILIDSIFMQHIGASTLSVSIGYG